MCHPDAGGISARPTASERCQHPSVAAPSHVGSRGRDPSTSLGMTPGGDDTPNRRGLRRRHPRRRPEPDHYGIPLSPCRQLRTPTVEPRVAPLVRNLRETEAVEHRLALHAALRHARSDRACSQGFLSIGDKCRPLALAHRNSGSPDAFIRAGARHHQQPCIGC